MSLTGKGVIVTGGARGIGRGSVEALLDRGARVVIVDYNQANGEAAEAELRKQYGTNSVLFIRTDVSKAKQLEDAFKASVEFLGYVDVIFNNAGVIDESNWEWMQEVNVFAVIRGSNLAFEHQRKDKGGRGGAIINVGSYAGLTSLTAIPIYTGTKHAVVGFTRCWSTNPIQPETGVRWCVLCPWIVDTDLLDTDRSQVVFEESWKETTEKSGRIPKQVVVDAFIRLVEDEDNNGAIMEVSKARGGVYRRRVLTDVDGSNPFQLDP